MEYVHTTVSAEGLSLFTKHIVKKTGHFYIGNTQQKLKTRMMQHFTEMSNLVKVGNTAYTFARHFASISQIVNKNKEKFPNMDVREMMRMSILWYGNPISCHKSFGRWDCCLCMKERIIILEEMRKGKAAGKRHLINSASELYGAFCHRPNFHRYSGTQPTISDEGHTSPKKSVSESSTSPPNSPFSHLQKILI